MGWVRDRMQQEMELRGLSRSTKRGYLSQARKFAVYHMKCPSQMGAKEIRKFLGFLQQERQLSPASIRAHVAALKFLYTHVLKRPEEVSGLPQPRSKRKLPDVLTGSEIQRLLDATRVARQRVMIMLGYGSGLRVSETASLRLTDLDRERMMIHVRDSKNGKDRYTLLPERVLEDLDVYCQRAKLKGPWLFPAGWGRSDEHHLCKQSIQRVVKEASLRAGIEKKVTYHLLRHTFATHLLESGVDIRKIQLLLGHEKLETTERYTHIARSSLRRARSPLDLIGTEEGDYLE